MILFWLSGISGLALEQSNRLAATGPFVHPGILHSRAELDFIRNKISAGAEPWRSAWEQLRSNSIAQLNWKPKPRAKVVRGVGNNPDRGASDWERDGGAAYAQALQWCFTGNSAHAEKAVEILNAWSKTLTSVAGHDARLLIGMAGINYLNAAELLRHTYKGWQGADQKAFEHLLREVFYPVIKDFYPDANGNWDAAMLQTMMGMGIFLEDRAVFNRAVDYYLKGRGNGAITNYINEFGEAQESGRDQAHTQMGLGYLGCAAEIAWQQGLDLYGAYSDRLATGFEYTAKYNLGQDVPYEPYRSIDGRYHYRTLSSMGRGRFRFIYERVYHHYHERRGFEMPFTKQVIEKIRPEGWQIQHASWGTLMHASLNR